MSCPHSAKTLIVFPLRSPLSNCAACANSTLMASSIDNLAAWWPIFEVKIAIYLKFGVDSSNLTPYPLLSSLLQQKQMQCTPCRCALPAVFAIEQQYNRFIANQDKIIIVLLCCFLATVARRTNEWKLQLNSQGIPCC